MPLAINKAQATPRLHAIAYLPYPRDPSKIYLYYARVRVRPHQITRGRPHARVRVKRDGEVQPILCAPYHGVGQNYTLSKWHRLRRTS